MTEKRYIFVGSGIEDNVDNESYLYNKDGFQDVCDLLNELSDENEKLKNKLKFFMELNKPYGTIIKENEKLKQLLLQFYTEDEINAELI